MFYPEKLSMTGENRVYNYIKYVYCDMLKIFSDLKKPERCNL
jgi:hypothetical protein